jgi:hypothetical protein
MGATPVELEMTCADLGATGGRARCGKEFNRCQRVVLPFGEDVLVMLEFGCCECGEHAYVRVTGIVRVCRVIPTAESEGRIE